MERIERIEKRCISWLRPRAYCASVASIKTRRRNLCQKLWLAMVRIPSRTSVKYLKVTRENISLTKRCCRVGIDLLSKIFHHSNDPLGRWVVGEVFEELDEVRDVRVDFGDETASCSSVQSDLLQSSRCKPRPTSPGLEEGAHPQRV